MFQLVNAGTVFDLRNVDLRYFALYTEDDYPIHEQFVCQNCDKSHSVLFEIQTCYVIRCMLKQEFRQQFGRKWDLRFSQHCF
jgi:hypothetical protein